MTVEFLIALVVHVFAAALLVGGSLFIWLVVVPASRGFGLEEPARTRIIGQVAKRFGILVHGALAALIVSGLYLAIVEFGSLEAVQGTSSGRLLLVKAGLIVVFLVLLYVHNVRFGRRIMTLAAEGRAEDLRRLRRRSRPVAYVNLVILTAIFVLGILISPE